MRPISGKRFCKVLERHGWTLDRISGSHHIYVKPGRRAIAIPVHGNHDLKAGTRRDLMRQAGLTDDDL